MLTTKEVLLGGGLGGAGRWGGVEDTWPGQVGAERKHCPSPVVVNTSFTIPRTRYDDMMHPGGSRYWWQLIMHGGAMVVLVGWCRLQ